MSESDEEYEYDYGSDAGKAEISPELIILSVA